MCHQGRVVHVKFIAAVKHKSIFSPHHALTQMAFQGTLYITDKHTCFTVEERNKKVPFKVRYSEGNQ